MAKRASAASADTASSFESEVLCKCQRRNQPPAQPGDDEVLQRLEHDDEVLQRLEHAPRWCHFLEALRHRPLQRLEHARQGSS